MIDHVFFYPYPYLCLFPYCEVSLSLISFPSFCYVIDAYAADSLSPSSYDLDYDFYLRMHCEKNYFLIFSFFFLSLVLALLASGLFYLSPFLGSDCEISYAPYIFLDFENAGSSLDFLISIWISSYMTCLKVKHGWI